MNKQQLSFQIPQVKNIDFQYKNITLFSEFPTPSIFKYGYNYYLIKNRGDILKIIFDPQYKNKNYQQILDGFYHDNKKIDNSIVKKFKEKIDKNFLNIWELLFFIKSNLPRSVSSLHIDNEINSIKSFRNRFNKSNSKNDKHKIINKPKNFSDTKKIISGLKTNFNIIIFDDEREKLVEQDYFPFFFRNLYIVLSKQQNNGLLIIAYYDTFTKMSLKIISLLKQLYKNISICKPFTVKTDNNKKYIICEGYKENTKIKKLIETIIIDIEKNNNLHINDILPRYKIEKKVETVILNMNQILVNDEFTRLKNIMYYLVNREYGGSLYEGYLNKQKNNNEWWIKTFL